MSAYEDPPITPMSKTHRTLSSSSTETPARTPGGGLVAKIREEKILVTVRVRPLNPKEMAMYDLVAWECPDDNSVVYKNPNTDRPSSSYTFDKVFGPTCTTQRVYEEGAKDVAMSALSGINATIFAYGQTSSGKTFTMRGITEKAINDIYEYMRNNPEREFLVKVSAMEIYNETVADLLNHNSSALRLLDDPEKGTIVDKLVEEVVKDIQHLRHLICMCEAARQVGETALNDKSSRSHQIIKLTIESRLRENSRRVKSFVASLNLVDLAGSERASQTKTNGVRLKEGSHINRSLLTLTQVIRKLSAGKRSGHIPYRESKLTRILQSSLGGNARTAIICTLSPALSHVDQSRNTLSFATSAKEVLNTARVNVVVSNQQMVKHLQKEVARLEAELRSPEPPSSTSCLKQLLAEKEMKIQEMEREMRELKRERDIAQSQLVLEKSARKQHKESSLDSPSRGPRKRLAFPSEKASQSRRRANTMKKSRRQSITSTDPSLLMQEIRKLEALQKQLGEEANRAVDVLHKEIASNRLGTEDATEAIANLLSEIKSMPALSSISEEIVVRDKAELKEEIVKLNSQECCTIEALEKKLEDVQNSIDKLMGSFAISSSMENRTPDTKPQLRRKKISPFNLSNSPNVSHFIRAPCSPLPSSTSSTRKVMDEIGNKIGDCTHSISSGNNVSDSCKSTPSRDKETGSYLSRENTPARKSNSMSVKRMQKMFKNAAEENIRSIRTYVTELKERVAKLQYQKQLLVHQVLELEANEAATASETETVDQSPLCWQSRFEDERKQIIMLWHLCHVSLVHRTQFYLLFRGDPADEIYMEVELNRLTWLEQHLSDLGNASPALLGDEPATYVSSSIKALKQEREYLAKRVSSKLSPEEREAAYIKWEIPAEGKQKRLQLANKLWTDPHDMKHVEDSAELVAKLVGFCEGDVVRKEMFELNFKSPSDKKTWMGWNLISNLLHL